MCARPWQAGGAPHRHREPRPADPRRDRDRRDPGRRTGCRRRTSARSAGEAVVDDERLFDGEVTGVRIEPMSTMPGLRARVLAGRMRPRRWVTGRAAQFGTTGALVVRDGEQAPRPVRRSTFYRHTQRWLARAVAGNSMIGEHSPTAPVGASQPDLPGHRRDHGRRRGAGLAVGAGHSGRWPTSASSSSSSSAGWCRCVCTSSATPTPRGSSATATSRCADTSRSTR